MSQSTDHILYLPYDDDYVQSANTLFHFMKEEDYLKSILIHRAIIPRYCKETVDYLNINNGTHPCNEIAILQKCFCDIPFHKLADSFAVNGVGDVFQSLTEKEREQLKMNNTHFDFYGKYAIAFSKSWGERKGLQPVLYLNNNSQYAKDFTALFEFVFSEDEVPNEISNDVINRLAFIKPLRGIMQRKIFRENSTSELSVDIYKNFHDEREWRYVPSTEALSLLETGCIIADPNTIQLINVINEGIESERYRALWLDFSYDDIRYIIVPDANARINIIKTIIDLDERLFEKKDDISMQKNVIISKIMVLDEIKKDW